MGYETRLYVVEKYTVYGTVYGSVIARFDLCKVSEISEKMRGYKDTDVVIYDGEKEIINDCYGEALKEIPLNDAISIIEEVATKDGFNYRRYAPCLGLLKGFEPDKWDDIVVLHYGY